MENKKTFTFIPMSTFLGYPNENLCCILDPVVFFVSKPEGKTPKLVCITKNMELPTRLERNATNGCGGRLKVYKNGFLDLVLIYSHDWTEAHTKKFLKKETVPFMAYKGNLLKGSVNELTPYSVSMPCLEGADCSKPEYSADSL